MITKDGRNTPIEQLTADNYIVPAGEEKQFHCVIEVRQHDPKTGARISRPRLQKFGAKIFERIVRDNLMKQGYEVTILHDPRAYIAEQAKKRAEDAKAAAEAAKKAEQERFDAAVAAAVEKALAAQKKTEKKGKKEKDENA